MKNITRIKQHRGLQIFSLILIAIFVQTGIVQSYNTPFPQTDKPYETVSLPSVAIEGSRDLGIKTKNFKNAKIDSALMEIAAAAQVSKQSALALADSKSMHLSRNRVQVQIITDADRLQGAKNTIRQSGGEVTGISADNGLIQAWLPVENLESAASDVNIFRIRQPAEMVLLEDVKAGNSTTEGLNVINGTAWHTAGYTGAGVKIAIIDGGFIDYPGLLGTDLPAIVTIKNFVDGELDSQVNGTTEHGTACAEIIYDIAPSASLYLVKVGTNIDLQEAVSWLISTAQVDIISTSLGWYNITPGDGTGEFATLVQSARDAGILWLTAAGNDREAHWGGAYNDSDGDFVHNFNVTQEINYFGPGDGSGYLIPAGYLIRVALRWDDWTSVNQDFDLYIYRHNGTDWEIAGYSENIQDGTLGQEPTEYAVALSSGSDSVYGFIISCYDCNRAVNFEVFAPKIARLDEILYARSLSNLADAPVAMTVAALDVTAPYPQENYSSQGPTNGPGGTANGGFNKPDISGFANVTTESYGSIDKFNGTSSATPHVAGAAALVLSAYPAYTPAQLQTFLQDRAVDMGTAGVDSIYGYGRLYLGAPKSSPTVTNISPNLALNNGSSHVTISGSDFRSGAAVKLTRTGQTDIPATNVIVIDPTTITADLNLAGAVLGNWNVVVTNTDTGTAQLDNGFIITDTIYNIYMPMLLKN